MQFQIWIQCQRHEVERIKSILRINGQLDKSCKVKAAAGDGELIVPTNLQRDHEAYNEDGRKEVLRQLGLADGLSNDAFNLIYLPVSSRKISTARENLVSIEDVTLRWIEALLETIPTEDATKTSALAARLPKRWSVYEPMVLLPAGSFQGAAWESFLERLDQKAKDTLWESILEAIWAKQGGKKLSHLAINAGIPPTQDSPDTAGSENTLRSPSGLVILYGDFGPVLGLGALPTATDFSKAFWVKVKQNGIYQTWAPRYTMFSRGNVTEKARILSFHDTDPNEKPSSKELSNSAAVDLYAGIGYFAFSYAAMGIGRVLCWEINPWSVEGLRRGAEMNKWSVKVIKGRELELALRELACDDAKLVVFEESNEMAAARIQHLRVHETLINTRVVGEIMHVNCGFLPSSESSWTTAWSIVSKQRSAWLHLHENVGVEDLEYRKGQIADIFASLPRHMIDVKLGHVELVKTFAPGVWHCVFDIHIAPR